MNLGCLLTEAAQAPRNLKHFVVDNGVYQTVGGLPMVNQARTDYAGIAKSGRHCRARVPSTTSPISKRRCQRSPWATVRIL